MRGSGPIFPNFNLYEIDWVNAQYEHLLPKIAPQVIAFKPDATPQLLTYINRISRQYMFTREPLDENNTYPDKKLPIIPNKFSRPVTQLWSPADQSVIEEVFDQPLAEIGDFSSDGRWFVSPAGEENAQINLWDTETWQPVHEFIQDATEPVLQVGFSPDDALFVSIQKPVLNIWNTFTGERVFQSNPINNNLNSELNSGFFHADISPDSTRLLFAARTALREDYIRELDLFTQKSTVIVKESSPVVFVNDLNDATILYVLEDGTAKIADRQSGIVVRQFNANPGGNSPRSIKLTPDKNTLFVGNEVWDLQSRQRINTLAENAAPLSDLQISDDGQWIATRHEDLTARVWTMQTILQNQSAIPQYTNY